MRDRHPLRLLPGTHSQWAAVERLRVCVVKLQAALPLTTFRDSFYYDIYPNVVSMLPPIDSLYVAHMKLPPQEIGIWDGYGYEVSAVDGDARTLLRRLLVRPALTPSLHSIVPKRQRLHSGGLPRVVRANEDHWAAQLDLDFTKALEIPNGELCKHILPRCCHGESPQTHFLPEHNLTLRDGSNNTAHAPLVDTLPSPHATLDRIANRCTCQAIHIT